MKEEVTVTAKVREEDLSSHAKKLLQTKHDAFSITTWCTPHNSLLGGRYNGGQGRFPQSAST